MMPIGDQHERGLSVASNVPTVDVNFDKMVNENQHIDEVDSLEWQGREQKELQRIVYNTMHRNAELSNFLNDHSVFFFFFFLWDAC